MLELASVSKVYGAATALHPTDLVIPAGRTTVLLGPSGCGKSTLLRLVVGLIAPTTGAITYDGQPVTPDTSPGFRRRVGFVVQDGGLFPHLTARGNATLMARYFRWDKGRTARRLDEVRDLTHFPADRLDAYPAEMSGGQKQRVSLMRALFLDPDLLLLDEPLGAVDPLVRADLQAELRDLFRQLKKTVVLVTHDLGEAAYLGDRLVLLQDGRVVQQGGLRDLLDRPASDFVTRFISAQRRFQPDPPAPGRTP